MLRFIQKQGGEGRQIAGIPPLLSAILCARGVDTPEKADVFLHPSLDQLHDPLKMQDMDKAVRLIREAAGKQTPIWIYGDYDCDGVCSTAIMMETLRELGAKPSFRIPKRSEGYGMNEDAVRELAKAECGLLITVDCGVTNVGEVALARRLGMQVIVTDHHQLGEQLPDADAVLNPLCGDYPFRKLCGAGVALKITQALLGTEGVRRRLELAALATVADIVPLTGENRVIVAEGMKAIGETRRPGLLALMETAGLRAPVSSENLAFRLAPRINAGGRMGDAALCVDLLLSPDAEHAQDLAEKLERNNQERKNIQDKITKAAEQAIRETDFYGRQVILASGHAWPRGVIGLAAGKLCEKYHWPTIVCSEEDGIAVGSCRSIPGVNIHAALTRCEALYREKTGGQALFIRFGGHEQAAGLTIQADRIQELEKLLDQAVPSLPGFDPACYIPAAEYDAAVSLASVTLNLVDELQQLEPTGFGNPAPLFLARGATVQQMRPVGTEKEHLKLTLVGEDGAEKDGIAFFKGSLPVMNRADVLFSPERNVFREKEQVQLNVRELCPAEGGVLIPDKEKLFELLLQEMESLSENYLPIPETGKAPREIAEEALPDLLRPGRGTLLIGHEGRMLQKAAALPGAPDLLLDEARGRMDFNALLAAPVPDVLTDVWRYVVLLDGDLIPGELSALRRCCPRAEVLALPANTPLRAALHSLRNAGTDAERVLKCLRADRYLSLSSLMPLLPDLRRAQVLSALAVLRQRGLAECRHNPWQARKRLCTAPGESPLAALLEKL